MKRAYLLILFILCIGIKNTNAQSISVAEAMAKATSLRSAQQKRAVATDSKVLSPVLAYTSKQNGSSLFYVFNYPSGGFAIIGGDATAKDILGYCESGTFNIDSIPDGLRYMLECYNTQIKNAKKNKSISQLKAPQKAESTKKSVGPLIFTQWNQSEPFNCALPSFGEGYEKLVTGCVATTMAQLMYYYKYPTTGSGSKKHTPRHGTLVQVQ